MAAKPSVWTTNEDSLLVRCAFHGSCFSMVETFTIAFKSGLVGICVTAASFAYFHATTSIEGLLYLRIPYCLDWGLLGTPLQNEVDKPYNM